MDIPCVQPEAGYHYRPLTEVLGEWAAALAAVEFALTWAGDQLEELTPASDAPHQLFSVAELARKAHLQARTAMMNCPPDLMADVVDGFALSRG